MEWDWNENLLFYFLEPYLKINPAQFEHLAEYYYLSIFSLYIHYIIIDLCSIVNVHIFVDVVAHDDLISYTIFNCAIYETDTILWDHAGELIRNPQVGNYGLDMIKKLSNLIPRNKSKYTY